MTDSLRIAVASEGEGGLSAPVGGHFGRCPYYTLVEVREGRVVDHEVHSNPGHENHVPGAVPEFLSGLHVNVVLAGGMGPRAIRMFDSRGIQVTTGVTGSVEGAVDAWLRGDVRGIVPCAHDHPESCGGHSPSESS
jgi:predicted Fe-Mo cluster-binding NifX family protein